MLADKVYSGRDQFRLSDLVPGLPSGQDEVLMHRQALHAYRIRFKHPAKGHMIEATAPLPAEFRRTLEALRQHRGA